MSELHKDASIVLEKNQMIFQRLMLLNIFSLLVIFSLSGLVAYRYLSKIERREAQRIYKSVEGLVLEGVFSYEKLGKGYEIYSKIAAERLEAAYKANNITAQVNIVPCSKGPGKPYDTTFQLRIGSEVLQNCVYVKNESKLISKLVMYMLLALLIALALPIIFWHFYKSRLNERILLPILKDLEERRVDAAIGDLAQHVAHNIRSPLAALELVANPNVNVSREDASQLIKQSIIRIREIANGILDKSKALRTEANFPQSPRAVAPENTELKVLVNNVIDEVKLVQSEKGKLTFKTELQENLKVNNVSLWNGLHRVLINLVTNAAESTHFKNGIVEVKAYENEGSVVIAIKDNGEGIEASVLNHMGKKGWTSKKDGNGLGIYKAKEFAKQYGGEITYQSVLGQGTECLLQFPQEALN